MNNNRRKTKVKESSKTALAEQLNDFASRTAETAQSVNELTAETLSTEDASTDAAADINRNEQNNGQSKEKPEITDAAQAAFNRLEAADIETRDYQTSIPVDSMEANIGYSSLLRQMHNAFRGTVAFYRSKAGGSLSIEDARAAAFHVCTNEDEAVQIFDQMMSLPLEILSFGDLMELQSYAPKVAEGFWEMVKIEGRAEFESGHLAANINFPVGYQKNLWNIARYLGVRESFIDDWRPQGGIEIAMIDMLAQTYF